MNRFIAFLIIALMTLAIPLGFVPEASADLIPQPAETYSLLTQNDLTSISDSDLAQIFASKMYSNVLDAAFIFQECFGGGMLDDITSAFAGSNTRWVSGSASTWAESSWGPADPTNNPDFWTAALLPELLPNNLLLNAIDTATANDIFGPNSFGLEHGQSTSNAGGADIMLKDPLATSYHAILWAGYPDGDRHANDIQDMRQAIINAWGDPATNPNVTIDVLFGNSMAIIGGQTFIPATRDNLIYTVNNLHLDSNSEFLFYATDHGSTIPEPGSLILLVTGLIGLGGAVKHKIFS